MTYPHSHRTAQAQPTSRRKAWAALRRVCIGVAAGAGLLSAAGVSPVYAVTVYCSLPCPPGMYCAMVVTECPPKPLAPPIACLTDDPWPCPPAPMAEPTS